MLPPRNRPFRLTNQNMSLVLLTSFTFPECNIANHNSQFPLTPVQKYILFKKLKHFHFTVYASQVSLNIRCGLPLSGKLCLITLQQPVFELQKLYKQLFMSLITSFSTAVNEVTSDKSSANNS